jgi:hypothetical protein
MSFFRNRFNATRRAASEVASGFANSTRRVYRGMSSGISSISKSVASTLGLDFSQTKLIKGDLESTINNQLTDIGKLIDKAVESGLMENVAGIVRKLILLLGDSMSPELKDKTLKFENLPKTSMSETIALQATLAAATISRDPLAITLFVPADQLPSEPKEAMTATIGGGPVFNASLVVALNVIKTALIIALFLGGLSIGFLALMISISHTDSTLIVGLVKIVGESISGVYNFNLTKQTTKQPGGTNRRQRRKNRR